MNLTIFSPSPDSSGILLKGDTADGGKANVKKDKSAAPENYNINYLYNASGEKVRKTVVGDSITVVTDYIEASNR